VWVAAALAVVVAGVPAALAGAWPEESLPENRLRDEGTRFERTPVNHAEWSDRLFAALDLSGMVPDSDPSDRFDALCPRPLREGVNASTRSAVRVAVGRSGVERSGGDLRVRMEVEAGAVYRLVVDGRGPGRWSVNGRPLGLLDPTPLGRDVTRALVPVGAGSTEIVAKLGPGASIEQIALHPVHGFCVSPGDGWSSEEGLDFGDKARTMVQALGLQNRLPADGPPLVTEGEHYEGQPAVGKATTRDAGRPASKGAWALADGATAEFTYRMEVDEPGVYTLLVRVHGGQRQVWSIGDEWIAGLDPEGESLSFAWNEVATLPLLPGEHLLRARVPADSGVDVIHLVKRRTGDMDYLRVLQGLGLREGPATRAVSTDAATRNLESPAFRRYLATFLDGPYGPDARLALVEHELERFYTRPLSPVLPGEQ
jgi:hypothetical protein